MRRAAADDRAQSDDSVVFAALGHLGSHQRNLEGSGDPGYFDGALAGTMPDDTIHGSVQQPQGDELVEPGDNDAELETLGVQHTLVALVFFCHQLILSFMFAIGTTPVFTR